MMIIAGTCLVFFLIGLLIVNKFMGGYASWPTSWQEEEIEIIRVRRGKLDPKQIDQEIIAIQRSTRTLFKPITPWHDKLRMKFRWYYRWHTNQYNTAVHTAVLTLSILFSAWFVVGNLHDPIKVEAAGNACETPYELGEAIWYDFEWINCGGGVPGAEDTMIIRGGTSLHLLDYGQGMGGVVANVLVDDGGELYLDSETLTVTGDFTNIYHVDASNSTLIVGGNYEGSSADFGNGNTTGDFANSTLILNSTTAGKTFNGGSSHYNNVTFDGSGGSWSIFGALDVNGNLTISAGTLNANNQNINVGGNLSVASGASFTKGTGTLTLDGIAQNISDANDSPNDFGPIATSGTTIVTMTDDFTISSLNIANGTTFSLGAEGYNLTLTGTGESVLNRNLSGTFNKGTDSTVIYSGSTTTTSIATVPYNNLTLSPVGGSATIYNLTGSLTGDNSLSGSLNINTGATLDTRPVATDYNITAVNITVTGTLDAASSSSNLTATGDWNHSSGTFDKGTSTVSLTGSGTLNTGGDAANKTFYNLSIAASNKTTTIASEVGIYSNLTIGSGTVTATSERLLSVYNSIEDAAPVSIDASGSTLNNATIVYVMGADTQITGSLRYSRLRIYNNTAATSFTGTMTGEVKTNGGSITIGSDTAGTTAVLDTANYPLTSGYELYIGRSQNNRYGKLIAGSSTITVSAGLIIYSSDNSGNNILDANSSSITVKGNFTNSDTFNRGTSTVTLASTATDQTITTNGQAFNNFILNNSGASGSDDVVISGALNIDGNLTITDGDLDLSVNNPAVNVAGSTQIGTNGSITKGTGIWTFNGTTASTYTDSSSSGPQDLGTVIINKTDPDESNNKLTLASSITVSTLRIDGTFGQRDTLDLSNGGHTLTLANSNNGTDPDVLNNEGNIVAGNSTINYAAVNSSGNINIATYFAYYNLQLSGAETYAPLDHVAEGEGVNNDLIIEEGATLDASSAGEIWVGGNWLNSGTFIPGSNTIILNGSANQTVTTSNQPFYHLTINNTGEGNNNIIIDGDLDIDGNLTITNGNLDLATNNPAINTAGDVTIAGLVTKGTGTWTFSKGASQNLQANSQGLGGIVVTANTTVAQTGSNATLAGISIDNLNISSSTSIWNAEDKNLTIGTLSNSGTLKLTGTNNTATITTGDSDSGTVEYTATSGSPAIKNWTYYDLKINGAGGVFRLTNNTIVGHNLNVAAGTLNTNDGTTDRNLTVAGNLSLNGTLVANASTVNIAGGFTNSGTFTAGTSTINLSGTATQSITSGAANYYNLTVSNTHTDGVVFSDSFSATNTFTATGEEIKRITFNSGSNYAIKNLLVDGSEQNRIVLTASGTWNLTDLSGTLSVDSVHVTNSNASRVITTINSVDNGGNTNWDMIDSLVVEAPDEAIAGENFQVTITAKDAADNTTANIYSPVTLSISSDTIEPTIITASSFVSGVWTGNATISKTGNKTITASYNSVSGSDTLSVNPAALGRFTISGLPSETTAGQAFGTDITVTTYDLQDNIKTDFTGKVVFSSTDGTATLPDDYTFNLSDSGIKTFGGSLFSLKSAGEQTITVSSEGYTGSALLTVNPDALSTITIDPASRTLNYFDQITFTSQGQDAYNNPVTFTPTWSVTKEAGTINSQTGEFIASNNPGTYTDAISVTSGGITGKASITINPTTITLTSPNGGEYWLGESKRNITWKTSGEGVATISLYYSLDNGSAYTKITEELSNSGVYAWNLPNVSSNEVLVKIEAIKSDGKRIMASDTSNQKFVIDKENPLLSITTPDKDTQYITQTTYVIKGIASDQISGLEKVEVSIDDSTWTAASSSDNFLNWTYEWANIGQGTHTIKARATDNTGNSLTSTALSVIVDSIAPSTIQKVDFTDISDKTIPVYASLLIFDQPKDETSGIKEYVIERSGTKPESITLTAGAVQQAKDKTLYQVDKNLTPGNHSYQVFSTDLAGNTSAKTAAKTVISEYQKMIAKALGQQIATSGSNVLEISAKDGVKGTISGVNAKPSSIITTKNNTEKTSATVSWKTNLPATSQVSYGLSSSYSHTTKKQTNLNMGHTVVLQDLEPGKTYHFSISSTDEYGNNITSGDQTFTTGEKPKKQTVLDTIIRSLQSTLAKLKNIISFKAKVFAAEETYLSVRDASEGGVKRNIIYWNKGGEVRISRSENGGGLNTLATTSSQFYLDTDLKEGVSYSYKIDGIDELKSPTNIQSSGKPVINDVKGQVLSVSEDKAQISIEWTTDKLSTSSVDYGTSTAYGSNEKDEALNTYHYIVIEDASPSTTIHFRVTSTDASTNTSSSQDYTVTIPPAPPAENALQIIVRTLQQLLQPLTSLFR